MMEFTYLPKSLPVINFSNILKGRISKPRLLKIHAKIFVLGAHQDNLIATRLIGHYPSRLSLPVFSHLRSPNIFPCNAIIRSLAEEGHFSSAFLIFKRLNFWSLSPNDLTFSFICKACFRASDVVYVRQVHTLVLKLGYGDDSFVCNGLLAVYAKGFNDLVSARKVFDDMPGKGLVCCWTSLIAGYAKLGKSEEALQLFLFMVRDNLRPDDDTMVSVLSACSNLDIENCEKWANILSEFEGNCGSNEIGFDAVNTVLVYLFGKLGKVEDCRHIFNKISVHGKASVISWNVMIGAYVQNADALEALSLFQQIDNYKSCPNHVTMVSVLSACAQIGDLELGVRIHDYMKSKGWKGCLALNRNLNTTLIDMYCKCGDLNRARDVFGGMFTKDVVSFNVMIMGLAINGEGQDALFMFSKMQDVGLIPDAGTFLGVLCACSHSGFLEKGRHLFADMSQQFFIYPKLEHYACYVDLLSRSGCIQEALEVVMSMPYEPNGFVWGSLLAGCVLHNKLEYGEIISKMLIRADPENSAGYVLLSNAYASDCRWGAVSELRCFMKEKGVRKQSGNSWISIEGTVHEFLAGSPSHPQIEQIFDILDELSMKLKLGIT
ncbi:hypothetical protein AgCh_022363 [Apium graveolens]